MKHLRILFVLVFLLVAGATVTQAQRDSDGDGLADGQDNCPNEAGPAGNNGCPLVLVIAPQQPLDTDGDGLPDSDDQCPTVAGPRENRGCPVETTPTGPTDLAPNPAVDTDGDGVPDSNDGCPTQAGPAHLSGCPDTTQDSDGDSIPDPVDNCPNVAGVPENNGCPPFTPPALPTDACYVTPNGDFRVIVREQPDLNAAMLGFLLPGVIYEAQGYVMVGTELWFVMTSYENSANITGYASRSVLNASACGEIAPVGPSNVRVVPTGEGRTTVVNTSGEFPWQVSLLVGFGEGTPEQPTQTVEYCIYQEVQEAGVFEEVCYEIEIPEGCVLTTAEAGVYTVDCGDGETVNVNPLFDGMPAVDFQGPSRDNDSAIAIGLRLIFNGPADPDDGPETVEYCIYQEVQEAGVFEEVCYEIEIPEGCVLTTAEAGVFTLDCDGEDVTVNPLFDDVPSSVVPVQRDPETLGIGMQMIYRGGGANTGGGTDTIEYCVYEEVQEVGVFEEVCYEIEAPEGCVFVASEAGVYTLDCDNEGTLNPDLGGLPAIDLTYPTNPEQPILIGLLLPAVQKVR